MTLNGSKKVFYAILVWGVLLVPVLFLSCSKVTHNPGDMVAAKYTDGKWYIAKINSCASGACATEFHDGTVKDIQTSDLKALPTKLELKAGDKVWAVWPTTNEFCDGTVAEVKDTGAEVNWDQGGTPSFVEFGRMTKR
ncbi:MAG: hypothetical protein JXA20_08565 [Spirochaetes bacterium]|nr:hypothetical protein [Spirochaetota bacterium]